MEQFDASGEAQIGWGGNFLIFLLSRDAEQGVSSTIDDLQFDAAGGRNEEHIKQSIKALVETSETTDET